MLRDMVDLNNSILAFETVLKIEYEENETKRVVDSAVRRLESAWGMRIEGTTLYKLESENISLADNVQNILQQIMECTKTVAFLFQCGMFYHSIPITLSTVKYLGIGKEQLRSVLRYFQNNDEYYLAENAVQQLYMGLDGIDMSTVKRLFIILLVLDKLGVREAVAIVAQYLYYGSVWEDKDESVYRD